MSSVHGTVFAAILIAASVQYTDALRCNSGPPTPGQPLEPGRPCLNDQDRCLYMEYIHPITGLPGAAYDCSNQASCAIQVPDKEKYCCATDRCNVPPGFEPPAPTGAPPASGGLGGSGNNGAPLLATGSVFAVCVASLTLKYSMQ